MKQSFLKFFIPFLLIGLLLIPSQAKAESYAINKVEIFAYILDDGDLFVEELFTYSFHGSFNGVTRTIGDDNHNGVSVFEAYLVQGNTNYNMLNRDRLIPLKPEKEDITFKIPSPSKNEKKQFFYRYRVEDAAKKYSDTAQLYWRFFDDLNENDLKNLSISFGLYDNAAPPESRAFLHETSGGMLTKKEGYFKYFNKLLPARETVEIRYIFPAEYLAKAPIAEEKHVLAEILKEEKQYKKKLAMMKKWEPILSAGNTVFFILSSLLILSFLIYQASLIRKSRNAFSFADLENYSSLEVAWIFRKGRLRHNDVISALFKLHQENQVSMEIVEARTGYLQDPKAPDETVLFTLMTPLDSLQDSDQALVSWLFTQNEEGQWTFTLDGLPFPTETEKQKNWRLEKEYIRQEKEFEAAFEEWAEGTKQSPGLLGFVKANRFREVLLNYISPVWIIWVLFSGFIMMMDTFFIGVLAIFLAACWVLAIVKKAKRKFLVLVFVPAVLMESLQETFVWSAVIFLVLSLIIPEKELSLEGAKVWNVIKKFRKQVMTPGAAFPGNPSDGSRLLQHAVSLDLAKELKWTNNAQWAKAFSVFPADTDHSGSVASIFDYTHNHYSEAYSSSSFGSSGSSSSSSGGGGGAGAY